MAAIEGRADDCQAQPQNEVAAPSSRQEFAEQAAPRRGQDDCKDARQGIVPGEDRNDSQDKQRKMDTREDEG